MAHKAKKKRTKKYQGVDAAVSKPSITRVTAANRSKLGQYWYDNKRVLKPVLIGTGVVALIVWFIIEMIRIAAN